jgi:hypothetical protein
MLLYGAAGYSGKYAKKLNGMHTHSSAHCIEPLGVQYAVYLFVFRLLSLTNLSTSIIMRSSTWNISSNGNI